MWPSAAWSTLGQPSLSHPTATSQSAAGLGTTLPNLHWNSIFHLLSPSHAEQSQNALHSSTGLISGVAKRGILGVGGDRGILRLELSSLVLSTYEDGCAEGGSAMCDLVVPCLLPSEGEELPILSSLTLTRAAMTSSFRDDQVGGSGTKYTGPAAARRRVGWLCIDLSEAAGIRDAPVVDDLDLLTLLVKGRLSYEACTGKGGIGERGMASTSM
jgi:hypothetical protein